MRKRTIGYVLVSVVLFLVLILYGLRTWVYFGALEAGWDAQSSHPGDKIEALISVLESEQSSLKEKNHAVWALGQLRDERAVPALEELYTGEPCDHNRFVCQREAKRALAHCKGERFDLLFWRRRRSTPSMP